MSVLLLHLQTVVVLVGIAAQVQPPVPGSQVVAAKVAWTYPLTSDSFGGPSVADADGDGGLDVALATYFGDSRVIVLRGRDGTPIWTHDAASAPGRGDACLDASSRFADLDGDGTLELIVPVSSRGEVLAFDAATGRLRWRHATDPIECTDSPPWIGQLGDGLGIVIGTFHGNVRVIGADGTLRRSFKVGPGFIQSCPVVSDIDGDGTPDFLVADFKGRNRLSALSGASGAMLWEYETADSVYHGPAVGDLDGDGNPDLVITDYSGTVHAVRSRDGVRLWTARPGDHYFMSPAVIADVDGQPGPEIVVASVNVTVLRADGSVLWSRPTDPESGVRQSVTRGVSVADLDGDGTPDLAFANTRGLLRVIRGRDGQLLAEFAAQSALDFLPAHASSGPAIADLTGDGRLDVVYVAGDARAKRGAVICLTGFAGPARDTAGQPLGWFMLRHDPHNTGNASTPLSWPPARSTPHQP